MRETWEDAQDSEASRNHTASGDNVDGVQATTSTGSRPPLILLGETLTLVRHWFEPRSWNQPGRRAVPTLFFGMCVAA